MQTVQQYVCENGCVVFHEKELIKFHSINMEEREQLTQNKWFIDVA